MEFKNFTLKGCVLITLLFFAPHIYSQTTHTSISVNWPSWSSENRVEVYNPSGTLITTIDNGYSGCCNDSYSTTVDLGCIADGNNYYIIMYDTYGDGWNGSANVTITTAGTVELSNTGAGTDSSGTTVYFDVNGGCISTYCTSTGDTAYNTGVTQVQFNTINNADGSPKDNGYEDFTAISTTVTQTNSYNLTVNVDTDGNYTVHAFAWIDWNQDYDFDDPGETYDLGDATNVANGATSLSPLSITIPVTATLGNTRMRIAAKYNSDPISCEPSPFDGEVEDYTLNVISATPFAEIAISGNGTDITDGDTTPSFTDATDFGSVDISGGTNSNTFTIDNLGSINLNLTGGSPYVSISGANAADFTLTANPSTPITSGGNTTFTIEFDPSATGLRTASVSIANDDSDENPFTFDIQGTGIIPPPCGDTLLFTSDFETGLDGWTSGGSHASRENNSTWSYSGNYSLRVRNADPTGSASSFDSPTLDLTVYDKVEFQFFFAPNSMDSTYDATPTKTATEEFMIEFSNDGGTNWTTVKTYESGQIVNKDADFETSSSAIFYYRNVALLAADYSFTSNSKFRVRCDADANDDEVYIDLVTISGSVFCLPTEGPGGVSSNLDLWLRSDMVDGSGVAADGSNINTWVDNGKGNDAKAVVSSQEPVYRNNNTDNFNFNPVIDFENDNNTSSSDLTYLSSRHELQGSAGFNSNDMFIVILPDPTITTSMIPMDTFTGSDPNSFTYAEDVTGFGFGSYTQRLTGEYFTYCIGTSSGTGPYVGYGRGDLTGSNNYNQINLINVRHNSGNSDMEIYLNANLVNTTANDLPSYAEVSNRKYWIGRSQYWNGSFDGKIAEIITYNSRKTDGSAERKRIESYLALKYGITLGTNGTSMDYVDSSGNTVWDINTGVPSEDIFNYNIAGIFRDDASIHSQKQSKTINTTDDITIGLGDLYATNSDNPNTFDTDREYLVWGNDNGTLAAQPPVVVDMSAGIPGLTTNVEFTSVGRTWKVVETGGDIGEVKVSIPETMLSATITPPGSYLMFISNSPTFSPTSEYRVMTLNGSDLETTYDFDGTKYITFGYAPQVVVERSVFFDGIQDYIDVGDYKDLNTSFTVSAWIKRESSATNVSILSKRDASFTEGYDLKISAGNLVEMVWNGGSEAIVSNTAIPTGEWHHIAVIFNSGTANLYIDGVLDNTATGLSNPVNTTQSFIIAAAGKTATTAFFEGNIDEVRIWDVALSEAQLRYIMNQEIEDNASFVNGMVLPSTITKNEVASIPWSDLAGYYPMSIFTYTNTNDHSDNQNQGALRNLDTVDFQTAPLPYETAADGSWDSNATWTNGSILTIPGSASLVDPNITVDWNIVSINHDLTMDNSSLPVVNNDNRTVQGLDILASRDLTVNNDGGLTVTHYLNLDGSIDLQGESQLIQNHNSVLTVGASGSLEKDQQGTADTFTYNYWSSPVGATTVTATNTTHESSYRIPDVLMDGTDSLNPLSINFITAGYNGTNTTPIGIADYWIWKFADQPDDDYSAWQHVRSTGTMQAGEGFTMKGPGTGSIATDQNYVFNGKPNNGDITLTISANNDYLIGNPYPSAIDAHEFLSDNPDTNGTLYFWEHWGGNSHNLSDYQGGYALYNYSGGVPTASFGTNDPDVATGGTPTKMPQRYIPVSQGFFVYSASGGTLTFENDQRVFVKESGGSSVFFRTSFENESQSVNYFEDNRMKFRIGFNSINQIHRQLLLTIDQNASMEVDWGYDGKLNEEQMDDMFWMIGNEKYLIQATNVVDEETIIPLGVNVTDNGNNYITIDHLENVPDEINIYVHDNVLDIYHDLRESDYQVYLPAGEYLNRFSIVFDNPDTTTLGVDDNELADSIQVFYNSDSKNIIILNPRLLEIDNLELFNILGQSVLLEDNIQSNDYSEIAVPKLSSGTYIINISTKTGKISKKVLVK